jgi:hypothetical protein
MDRGRIDAPDCTLLSGQTICFIGYGAFFDGIATYSDINILGELRCLVYFLAGWK